MIIIMLYCTLKQIFNVYFVFISYLYRGSKRTVVHLTNLSLFISYIIKRDLKFISAALKMEPTLICLKKSLSNYKYFLHKFKMEGVK